MDKDKATKAQSRAYVLTFICIISLVILGFLLINQPSGMAALYLIFPMAVVAGLHIFLGTGAIISTVMAGNHLRNSWIYIYFTSVLLFVLIWSGSFTNLQKSYYKKADAIQYKKELQLFQAIKQKDIIRVEQIIKTGVNLSHCFNHDRTLKNFSPLQYSFYFGTEEINHALLSAGADPVFSCAPAADSRISSPIVLAVQGQDVKSVIFLLNKNVLLSTPNNSYPLLPVAIAGTRHSLPSYNSNPRYQIKKPNPEKTRKIVKLLLAAGAPLNDFYHHGTALHWALASDDYELVELLLKAGADPNIFEKKHPTRHLSLPLLTAIQYRRPELARLLLTNTPPADINGWTGFYALITAAKLHDSQTVNFILQAGFDIKPFYDEKNPDPHRHSINEVLYDAIRNGDDSVVSALLTAGADINRPFLRRGFVSPITALVVDNLEILKKVVALGGDVNAKDINGSAPLHRLASCKSCSDPLPAMENLLQLGADINIHDKRGKTPLQRAISAGLADTQQFLRSHGAKATQLEVDK
jgi:ankyrin repeat protein